MGLVVSLLVVFVGVIEALSCYHHFQIGLLRWDPNVFDTSRRGSLFTRFAPKRRPRKKPPPVLKEEPSASLEDETRLRMISKSLELHLLQLQQQHLLLQIQLRKLQEKEKKEKDKAAIVRSYLNRTRKPNRSISMPERMRPEPDALSKIIDDLAKDSSANLHEFDTLYEKTRLELKQKKCLIERRPSVNSLSVTTEKVIENLPSNIKNFAVELNDNELTAAVEMKFEKATSQDEAYFVEQISSPVEKKTLTQNDFAVDLVMGQGGRMEVVLKQLHGIDSSNVRNRESDASKTMSNMLLNSTPGDVAQSEANGEEVKEENHSATAQVADTPVNVPSHGTKNATGFFEENKEIKEKLAIDAADAGPLFKDTNNTPFKTIEVLGVLAQPFENLKSMSPCLKESISLEKSEEVSDAPLLLEIKDKYNDLSNGNVEEADMGILEKGVAEISEKPVPVPFAKNLTTTEPLSNVEGKVYTNISGKAESASESFPHCCVTNPTILNDQNPADESVSISGRKALEPAALSKDVISILSHLSHSDPGNEGTNVNRSGSSQGLVHDASSYDSIETPNDIKPNSSDYFVSQPLIPQTEVETNLSPSSLEILDFEKKNTLDGTSGARTNASSHTASPSQPTILESKPKDSEIQFTPTLPTEKVLENDLQTQQLVDSRFGPDSKVSECNSFAIASDSDNNKPIDKPIDPPKIITLNAASESVPECAPTNDFEDKLRTETEPSIINEQLEQPQATPTAPTILPNYFVASDPLIPTTIEAQTPVFPTIPTDSVLSSEIDTYPLKVAEDQDGNESALPTLNPENLQQDHFAEGSTEKSQEERYLSSTAKEVPEVDAPVLRVNENQSSSVNSKIANGIALLTLNSDQDQQDRPAESSSQASHDESLTSTAEDVPEVSSKNAPSTRSDVDSSDPKASSIEIPQEHSKSKLGENSSVEGPGTSSLSSTSSSDGVAVLTPRLDVEHSKLADAPLNVLNKDECPVPLSSERKGSTKEPFWLIFSGEYTKAMSKDWHSGHFSCWQCDEPLTGQRYVLRDDHPYCIKCYESVFANACEECNKTIGIDSKDLSYKDKHWHEACFLCNKCRVSLVDKQFGSKADKIYCGNCYDAQFASRCDGCGEIFRAGTKKMEYKTRQWHEKCFCCCVCKTAIGTKSFIPREQEIYCSTCYEEKFATRCVKCNKIITSGGVTYKNEPWHRDCFTCTNCNTSLAGQRFTSRDEKPYCAECFGELFAKRCTSCSRPITGIGGTRFISFEDRHWHNDCFICASCKTSLVGRGFITDGDDIICPECAKQKLM